MFFSPKKSLRLKFIFVLLIILFISFSGLSISIVNVQTSLLTEMNTDVDNGLKKSGKETAREFNKMEFQVDQSLIAMSNKVSDDLSQSMQKALTSEKLQIQKGMEENLLKNVKSIAELLSRVAPAIIMDDRFSPLVKYSKAAAKPDEIIFALFIDPNGDPFPGYINISDEKISQYIKKGKGETNGHKVINQSKNDSNVIIYEEPIEYHGTILGKTIVCITKEFMKKELAKFEKRFADLIQNNEKLMRITLKDESDHVVNTIAKGLCKVSKKSLASIKKTGVLLHSSTKSVNSSIKKVITIVGLVCSIGTLGLLFFLFGFIVINPIKEISEGLKDIAQGEGDLTKRLASNRSDEIGILAGWFDAFLEKLNNIILEIGENAGMVTDATKEVFLISERMSEGAQELSTKTNTVAAATEEMSSSMNGVAAASEEASINLARVSDSATRMEVTFNEVVHDCKQARTISDNASMSAENTSDKVKKLGLAANEIDKVTELITEIAGQTNLLALNATIEAARAGEAGKGFAVVANEIKSLSVQTSGASFDIKAKIQGIKNASDDTIQDVGNISEVISEANKVVSAIAAAIEKQSATTTEVAQNIDQASTGIDDVNSNVVQSSQVASEVTGDISGINDEIKNIFQQSSNMKENAKKLSDLSSTLKDMISVFKVSAKDTDA